jgi:hypothetical protein
LESKPIRIKGFHRRKFFIDDVLINLRVHASFDYGKAGLPSKTNSSPHHKFRRVLRERFGGLSFGPNGVFFSKKLKVTFVGLSYVVPLHV